CRAGAVTARYYGAAERLLDRYAWGLTNSGNRAWPRAQLLPNDLGLFDMLGNVEEWCQWPFDNPNTDKPTSDSPMLEVVSGADRSLRGRSFTSQLSTIRSSGLATNFPTNTHYGNGLRLARTLR